MPSPTSGAIVLDSQSFELLQKLICTRFGLVYTVETAYLIERRLQQRLEANGLSSFFDYYQLLTDPTQPLARRERELQEIFELLSTRETYFFRESYQLDAFREVLLPQLHYKRPRGQQLSVWSAGCASGEEPYSIAVEIIESGLFDGWNVRIIGSDLSSQALHAAVQGIYGPSSFRQTDPGRHNRYFRPLTGRWQIIESVRRMCTFVRLNLIEDDFGSVGGPFDAIFCRNVISYFDRSERQRLIERLSDKLAPGGYLFLGHAESLLDGNTPLGIAHLGRELVYRKPS